MIPASLRSVRLVAGGVLVVSVVVLAVQLSNPTDIVVASSGADADFVEIGRYFTYRDVLVATVAALLLGVSSTVFVLELQSATDRGSAAVRDRGDRTEPHPSSEADVERSRTADPAEVTATLSGTERVVYEAVVDADGRIAQREIVDRTDLSKATVSRTLDTLESKDLLERRRQGIGNVVTLS